MKFILANAFRDYRIRLTNPILPMWDILVPVVYLVIFGSSLERWIGPAGEAVGYPLFLLGGVLAMVTFSIALNSSYSFFEDLQSGIFHEMLTYPFRRRDLLLGKFIFNALFGVVGSLICIATAALALDVRVSARAVLLIVPIQLLGTACWYFLLTWLSLRMRGFNAYHTTTSALYLLLMFVSNLFYPTATIPGWIRWLAWLNPVTWQVDLLRFVSYGEGELELVRLEGVALVAAVAATFALANRKLNGPIR